MALLQSDCTKKETKDEVICNNIPNLTIYGKPTLLLMLDSVVSVVKNCAVKKIECWKTFAPFSGQSL